MLLSEFHRFYGLAQAAYLIRLYENGVCGFNFDSLMQAGYIRDQQIVSNE